MIEDFLARSGITRCSEFKDTAEAISKVIIYYRTYLRCCINSFNLGWIQNVSQHHTHCYQLVN